MKKEKQNVCPGCGRHCTADSVRCKYGRAYFAKRAADQPQEKSEMRARRKKKPEHKWKKCVSEEGLVWQLLSTCAMAKKGLRSGELTEAQLLAMLDEAERAQLSLILGIMREKMKNLKENV